VILVAFVAVPVIFLLTYVWAPCGASLTGGTFRIHRRGWAPLEVPVSRITTVELSGDGKLRSAGLRVFGDGGFFGSYGWFWNRTLGLYRLFTTRIGRMVVLHVDGMRPIVVIVDAPEALHQALQTRVSPA